MATHSQIETKISPPAAANERRSAVTLAIDYVWYIGAYLIFAVLGCGVSIICLPLSFIFVGRGAKRFGQRLIHSLFAFFIWYVQLRGLIKFDFGDLPRLRGRKGVIIVANHPCLIDVLLVVSRLPNVICIMKASLTSNLVLCGTARLAGYVDNRSHREMVVQCKARLVEGSNFLIFPEGTRTVEPGVNPFKMGFALVAKVARAPVQTIFIETISPFLGKSWPLLKWPSFPVTYTLRLGKEFVPPPDMDVKDFGKSIEDYFRANLRG